ncbi:MAG TPA: hypothetical protein V6D15_04250 [Oculatellaceae cyanobacterium]|jgi:hypothetical protein
MFKFILAIIRWLQGGALKLLTLAGIILLIWGIVSPVGTLVWWLNEGADNLGLLKKTPNSFVAKIPPNNIQNDQLSNNSNINCYIIFLPGVGDFSGDQLTDGERLFLTGLVEKHSTCDAVADVFPYSVSNDSLGGERLLAPIWRFAEEAQGLLGSANVLIKIRNLWRFAISADSRYGTIYNQGIASAIIERMNAVHPIPQDSNQPIKIILIGTSGGVEVALNAVPYLKQWLASQTKIIVVSIGGVFNGRNGFQETEHIYHLRGERDLVEDLGGVLFPSRWLWNVTSPFVQARLRGIYTSIISGNHAHDGEQGYFGEDLIDNSQTKYVDLTLQQVNQLPIWSD